MGRNKKWIKGPYGFLAHFVATHSHEEKGVPSLEEIVQKSKHGDPFEVAKIKPSSTILAHGRKLPWKQCAGVSRDSKAKYTNKRYASDLEIVPDNRPAKKPKTQGKPGPPSKAQTKVPARKTTKQLAKKAPAN